MAYFLMSASASYLGTKEEWVMQADNLDEAYDVYSDVAIAHIESYDDISEWEEENGVEYEYSYYIEEITVQEYSDAIDEGKEDLTS